MTKHLLLPGVCLKNGFSHPAFNRYLRDWREQTINNANDGIVSASACLQAVFVDLVLEGKIQHDWLSVMSDLLTNTEGNPIAYSRNYGKQLYKFEEQYLQSTIHAIHTRWWIEKLTNPEKLDHEKYSKLILAKKNINGLIYDADISETTLRHRMNSELTMSAAMGAEILFESGKLTDILRDELSTSLCDLRKVSRFGYMVSEQFRLAALRILSHEEQFPVGIEKYIEACTVGLMYGWNDFVITSKKDVYMGTAKRTSYDKPIHSPLVACHVAILANKAEEPAKRTAIFDRLNAYALKLAENPLDIPAFQMRDVPISFGANITPIEAICASWIIDNRQDKVKEAK